MIDLKALKSRYPYLKDCNDFKVTPESTGKYVLDFYFTDKHVTVKINDEEELHERLEEVGKAL